MAGPWEGVEVVEIVAGRHGFYAVSNANRVPLGGLITLKNATLGDFTWRTGGGAAKLGSAVAAIAGQCAIDYWVNASTQRTVVACDDGSIRKDDGAGTGWVTLKSGLTTAGAVPHLSVAGAEAAGNNRKLFYTDGINVPQVLSADGATTADIATPNADWSGANEPRWSVPHQGYNWAGGNANHPHAVYRSLATAHEDFNTTPTRYLCGPLPLQQYTVGALSYKGGLLVFCYPVGVYFIDTITDVAPANWYPVLVATPGAAGPRCFTQVEDDVVWTDPEGAWHSLAATMGGGQEKASARASDISYRKLGSWGQDNMALGRLPYADMVYYGSRQEVMLAHAALGQTAKQRRLHLDLNNRTEVGENWILWDRDRNEALYLRIKSNRQIPAMMDNVGQLWELDRTARDLDGASMTWEFRTMDTDFSHLKPRWAGRYKNLRFVQVEYVSSGSAATLTLQVWLDGTLRQTISLSLPAVGATLPATLPFTLASPALGSTSRRRLYGRCKRLAFRAEVTATGSDLSVAKLIFGLTEAA